MIPFIQKLARGENLSLAESREAMGLIMEGRAEPAQIGAFLTALSIKGATPDEIAGAAMVMRQMATPIDVGDLKVIDTCGTGGTGKKPFNVSTGAALVAAGAGAYVAKHGNRGATSQCGSSDVLEALGVNIQAPPAVVARCIREAHIGFLFAPLLHGAMKHAVPIRKAIGIPTVFNILGPLTNPAGARRQVMGVFAADLVRPIAEVLLRLGAEHALVLHSVEGLDEITLSGATRMAEVRDGRVHEYALRPADLRLPESPLPTERVRTPKEGADILRAILAGKKGPNRNLVLANAAAAVYVAGLAETLVEGVGLAAKAVDSGAAVRTLEALVKCSHSAP